jgi:hypothetical protein
MQNNAPITSAEAGVILGVSARTVSRFAETGELECIRKLPGPNGDYLFDPAVVQVLADKRAEQAKATA